MLQAQGFAQVSVRHWPAVAGQPALWQVRAEPRRWRQSQVDALGMALAQWRKAQASGAADELLLTLTYQREPVLHAYTSAACLDGWLQGRALCEGATALRISRDADWPAPLQARLATRRQAGGAVLAEGDDHAWMPQFELGPNLRTSVGTEFGLLDYSLALDLGTEVNLAPGLFVQGVASTRVANSADYDPNRIFGNQRHPGLGFDSLLLSYWKTLPHGVSAQANAGYIDRSYKGLLGDAVWMNQDGRWRLSATAGALQHDVTGKGQTPLLGGARYSLVPGAWQLEATAGRFLNGDAGYMLASNHWFGDTMFKLYFRDSQGERGTDMAAQRKFLGFSLSLPIGPKAAQDLGPVSVRGRDRWAWGLQTKVGERDNAITYGYGEIPRARHGVQTDVSDFDRNGRDDLLAHAGRLRAVLAQQLGR
jgi:hypothetical protein